MSDDADEMPGPDVVDPEMRQMLGMFDVPAFAKRGHELESSIVRLHARCRREREEMLGMVRLRLKQWAEGVEGPDAWRGVFQEPIEKLWILAGVEPGAWGLRLASARRRRGLARELASSVGWFNRRWDTFIQRINLDPTNTLIDHYNRFYLLEKECVMRSPRLAARHFEPRPRLTTEALLADHPLLPPPTLIG